MSKRDKMPRAEETKRPVEKPEPLNRVVELARGVLRERGLTEEQITAVLARRKAPDDLR
jgi:hypothetical protein